MVEAKLEQKTLREWREEFGLSQRDLAGLCGYARATINSFELGDRTTGARATKRISEALGLHPDQILAPEPPESMPVAEWVKDGYARDAPRKPLRWWREHRAISQVELARLAEISSTRIGDFERMDGPSPRPSHRARRKIANVLRVAPDKLIFSGDKEEAAAESSVEEVLRAELRGTRRALRKAHDFIREDPNISLKALDKRDAILPDIERELRGT